MKTIFLFDLDSTITKQEILPTIAEKIGKKNEMHELTEKTMLGILPFQDSFTSRVKLLSQIPVSEVAELISHVEVNEELVKFLNENKEDSYIVTSNLDVWIEKLMKKIGMEGRYYCSKAKVENDKIVKIESILEKSSVQNELTSRAKIVAIGDGSNDFDMIRKADIGISFGGVREIAPSLIGISDYSVYDEKKLYKILTAIKNDEYADQTQHDKTVIISCAGMGTRLGAGIPKALIDISGEPLIIHTLKMLDKVEDVRVVVGYQAEKVIDTVKKYRSDVLFVYNHNYQQNGTGASVSLAKKYGKKYFLTIDGDLLIHPNDMEEILASSEEFVGVCEPSTDDPVLVGTKDGKVTNFYEKNGPYEWTGVTMLESKKVTPTDGHVLKLVEQVLPMNFKIIREKEIDTPNDYKNAIIWVENNYND